MHELGARQRAVTRRELERDAKKRDRALLARLRDDIRAKKLERKRRLKAVTCNCRAARKRNAERAKRARVRLSQSIKRTRERAQSICALTRGAARTDTLQDIGKAVDALHVERASQRQLAAWTAPPARKQMSRRDERAESDDQVANNIDDPGLRVVWERVKHKIKAGKRRSRTEAFFEWAAEHASDVYAIQEAGLEAELVELERQERALRRDMQKPLASRRPARSSSSAVPF